MSAVVIVPAPPPVVALMVDTPNDLVEGPVGGGEQVARQRNGGSEDAVGGVEESIHLHRPTGGEQVLLAFPSLDFESSFTT